MRVDVLISKVLKIFPHPETVSLSCSFEGARRLSLERYQRLGHQSGHRSEPSAVHAVLVQVMVRSKKCNLHGLSQARLCFCDSDAVQAGLARAKPGA